MEDYRAEHGPAGARKLVPLIAERFGVHLHPRGLEKALSRASKSPGPRSDATRGDAARYERWGGLWLDGADSGVIAVMRFHACARRWPWPGPLASGSRILPGLPGPVPVRVVDEAATLVRRLLDGTRGERHA